MPGIAHAQAYQCAVPDRIDAPRADGPSRCASRKRVLPIGGYTLALTWAPQYCHANAREASASFQCGSGNRFGFTLHGLWPDGRGREWPQYCAPAAILDAATIRAQPVRDAVGAVAAARICQARHLHGRVAGAVFRSLDRAVCAPALSRHGRAVAAPRLTAGQFATAFARANRGITPAMLRVTANRQGWLDEVWLCLDTRFAFTPCPATQGRADATTRLKIWRGA